MRTIDPRSAGRLAAAFAALLIVVAACTSSGGGADASGGTAASPAPAASPAAGGGKYSYGEEDEYGATASKPTGGEAVVVNVANGTTGAYLTGADGRTLYVFKKDSGTTSACQDACAANWPPLIAAGTPTAGDGVGGALTTFARPDGSMQVAYDGAPLYYYVGDTAAGDTKGQGMGEVWFIATP